MKTQKYTMLGHIQRKDGIRFVYEIDWDYVNRRLSPKAEQNKRGYSVMGPIRVRVIR